MTKINTVARSRQGSKLKRLLDYPTALKLRRMCSGHFVPSPVLTLFGDQIVLREVIRMEMARDKLKMKDPKNTA